MKIGSKLYRIEKTDDTIAWARENLAQAPDGSVFLADVVTKARGRHGRSWVVSPGQIMVTILLKPAGLENIHSDELSIRLNQLNMALTLGILEPLKAFKTTLKWPNDFIIDNKKIGGVLVQLVWQHNLPVGIIVGFAINVNNDFLPTDPLHETATSLKAVTGSEHNMRALYKDILVHLNTWYAQWRDGNYAVIYRAWKKEQSCTGKQVSMHGKDGKVVKGVVLQLLPNGDVVISDENKKQHHVSFYQVEELKLS